MFRHVHRGIIEPSAAASLIQLVRSGGPIDLSDQYFVLFGASSAMGPCEVLLEFNANVIAVDIPRVETWMHLLQLVDTGRYMQNACMQHACNIGKMNVSLHAEYMQETCNKRALYMQHAGEIHTACIKKIQEI